LRALFQEGKIEDGGAGGWRQKGRIRLESSNPMVRALTSLRCLVKFMNFLAFSSSNFTNFITSLGLVNLDEVFVK
jgi:hypothetical protein